MPANNQEEEPKECSNCGAEYPRGAEKCPRCGAPLGLEKPDSDKGDDQLNGMLGGTNEAEGEAREDAATDRINEFAKEMRLEDGLPEGEELEDVSEEQQVERKGQKGKRKVKEMKGTFRKKKLLFCPVCGTQVSEETNECPNSDCGVNLE